MVENIQETIIKYKAEKKINIDIMINDYSLTKCDTSNDSKRDK